MVAKKRAETRQAQIAIALRFVAAPGADEGELGSLVGGPLDLALSLLESEPALRLNLSFSGAVLEQLARGGPSLDRLRTLWREDRVEILGGPHHDAPLPAVPERDARGQLQLHSAWMQQHLGRLPTGLWSPLRLWDSALIPTLRAAGGKYTIVDDEAFRLAGVPRDAVHGPWVTSRLGEAITVFAHERDLGQALLAGDAEGWAATLSDRARPLTGPEVVDVVTAEVHARRWEAMEVVRWTASHSHAARTWLLDKARTVLVERGRVHLPSSGDRVLAPSWSNSSPDPGRRVRRRRCPGWDVDQGPLPAFENVFARYEEAGRLADRWRRVSDRAQQLRDLLQVRSDAGQSGEQDRKARKLLERACEAVWRAQYHGHHWFDASLPDVGLYDHRRRVRVLRELISAERLLDKVLGDPAASGWGATVADVDGDGRDETLVRTPHLSLLVTPGKGGGLAELDLRDRGAPLLTALSPIEEAYHSGISGTEIRLVPTDDDEGDAEVRPPSAPLLASATVEGVPRGTFLDHFLAPEATARAFARRQFRDLGDFAVYPFELMRVAAPSGEQSGEVLVGRTGTVRDVERTQLLRLERSFRPDSGKPRLTVRTVLRNRSRDAASVWYGLEWTLGASPGHRLRVHRDDDTVDCSLDEQVLDLSGVSGLEWEDPSTGTVIVVSFSEVVGLWCAPVETVHPDSAGWCRTRTGHCVLAHMPIELWGGDGHTFDVQLDFLPLEPAKA